MAERDHGESIAVVLTSAGHDFELAKESLKKFVIQAENNLPDNLRHLTEFYRAKFGVAECFTAQGLIPFTIHLDSLEQYAAFIGSLGEQLAVSDEARSRDQSKPSGDPMRVRTYADRIVEERVRPATREALYRRVGQFLRNFTTNEDEKTDN